MENMVEDYQRGPGIDDIFIPNEMFPHRIRIQRLGLEQAASFPTHYWHRDGLALNLEGKGGG